METLPLELYGVAGGAMIMLMVEALKEVGLPTRFAGLCAILLGWAIGAALLLVEFHFEPARAALLGLIWGLAIVVIHNGVIKPLVKRTEQPPD